jgi:hypothetical protein
MIEKLPQIENAARAVEDMLRALQDGPRATSQVQEDVERRAEEQAEDVRKWVELENQLEDAKKVNQMLTHRIRELEAGRNGQSSCSDIPRTT